MTELTDEAVTKLANDCVLAANCMEAEDTFPTGQDILREAARALLDARAERDRLRADAQAANGVWKANLRLQGELAQARADAQAAVALVVEQAAEEVDRHYAAGDMGNPGHWVRSIAPADGLAAVEALRKERDRFEAALGRACLVGGTTYLIEIRDRLAAELAAAQQREAGIKDMVLAVENAINEPPRRWDVEPMEVRDYRHDLYRVWSPLCAALSHNGRGE